MAHLRARPRRGPNSCVSWYTSDCHTPGNGLHAALEGFSHAMHSAPPDRFFSFVKGRREAQVAAWGRGQGMIRKSVQRFSEKIMRK